MGCRAEGSLVVAILLLLCGVIKGDDVLDAMEMSDAQKEVDKCPVSEYGLSLAPA